MNCPPYFPQNQLFGDMYGKQHEAFANYSPTQMLAVPLEAGRDSEHVHQSIESWSEL